MRMISYSKAKQGRGARNLMAGTGRRCSTRDAAFRGNTFTMTGGGGSTLLTRAAAAAAATAAAPAPSLLPPPLSQLPQLPPQPLLPLLPPHNRHSGIVACI